MRSTVASVQFSSRLPLSTIASNTGCTSVGDSLMTRRMSALAVWWARASCVSWNRRAFWIAITAWSAKVWSMASSLSANAPRERATPMAPMPLPFHIIGAKASER